ncbi:hypothetical protein Tther_01775 [Tepidimonas thermarum]|uniref:Uncharacterized protein n=1 Tax=Tepidimonas thermarum TaxID=335431 RepID=A0A554WZA7_9BURK|nr:hypothetical protein Tther_01775 [Tepidimonas thermarum]
MKIRHRQGRIALPRLDAGRQRGQVGADALRLSLPLSGRRQRAGQPAVQDRHHRRQRRVRRRQVQRLGAALQPVQAGGCVAQRGPGRGVGLLPPGVESAFGGGQFTAPRGGQVSRALARQPVAVPIVEPGGRRRQGVPRGRALQALGQGLQPLRLFGVGGVQRLPLGLQAQQHLRRLRRRVRPARRTRRSPGTPGVGQRRPRGRQRLERLGQLGQRCRLRAGGCAVRFPRLLQSGRCCLGALHRLRIDRAKDAPLRVPAQGLCPAHCAPQGGRVGQRVVRGGVDARGQIQPLLRDSVAVRGRRVACRHQPQQRRQGALEPHVGGQPLRRRRFEDGRGDLPQAPLCGRLDGARNTRRQPHQRRRRVAVPVAQQRQRQPLEVGARARPGRDGWARQARHRRRERHRPQVDRVGARLGPLPPVAVDGEQRQPGQGLPAQMAVQLVAQRPHTVRDQGHDAGLGQQRLLGQALEHDLQRGHGARFGAKLHHFQRPRSLVQRLRLPAQLDRVHRGQVSRARARARRHVLAHGGQRRVQGVLQLVQQPRQRLWIGARSAASRPGARCVRGRRHVVNGP